MPDLSKCQKVEMPQATFYFQEYDEVHTHGYLHLEPFSSLEVHNRERGIENLTQIKGKCVMIVFDNHEGTNHLLDAGDKLKILPEGVWHIHSNPFAEESLTEFYFEGDIRKIVESLIDKGKEK